MRPRAYYFLIALLSVLVMACQMPAGFGPQRNLVGEGEDAGAGTWTSGSLSVVIDEERGQAVFINENGERFDISAMEYEGAPLIRCVQVESFSEIPPADDPEALQIKALVTGTRNDGTLGAWEIHNDNSIHLTVGEDGQARCLDGSESTSILDGMQTYWGWKYTVTGSATDGRIMIIVGYAVHARGFTYGSVQVLPGTSVGVYWKVWRLPYGRFCLISPPRIIGNLEKPAPYSRMSLRLVQLKLFFSSRLESYLTVVNPSPAVDDFPATPAVRYDSQQKVYVVNGVENQDGVHAFAKIDAYGGITILPAPPDLALSLSPTGDETVTVKDNEDLLITPAVANQGVWPSEAGLLEVKILDGQGVGKWSNGPGADVRPLAPGKSLSFPQGPFKPADLGLAPGTYQIVATVRGNPDLKELNAENDSQNMVLTVTEGTPPPMPLEALAIESLALDAALVWPGTTVVLKAVFDDVVPSTGIVRYLLSKDQTPSDNDYSLLSNEEFPEGYKTITVDPDIEESDIDTPPFTVQATLPADVPASGTWWVLAQVGKVEEGKVVYGNYLPAKLKVYYTSVVIDTYNPTGTIDISPINWIMDLFGPDGAQLAFSDSTAYLDSEHIAFPFIWSRSIEPGAAYYVRVRAENSSDSAAYAIRLLAQDLDAIESPRNPILWYFDEKNPTDDFGAPADDGIPTRYQELVLDGKLNCYIKAEEVDWFRFVLPE